MANRFPEHERIDPGVIDPDTPHRVRDALLDLNVPTLAGAARLPLDDLALRLQRSEHLPTSEAILGVLVLDAVGKLREATVRLDESSNAMLTLTHRAFIVACVSTLIAVAALVVTIVK